MTDDIIVAEVRQARTQLLEAAGGSLGDLIRWLRTREQQAGRSPVDLPPEPSASPLAPPRAV